jgi:hypothetical protein
MGSGWFAAGVVGLAMGAAYVCNAKTATPKCYVSAQTRDIVGGRGVLFVMEGPVVSPTLRNNPFSYGETGLPTAMFSSYIEMQEYRRKMGEAQNLIAPLRRALSDYDFDGIMRRRLEDVVMSSSWLGAQHPALLRNGNPLLVERQLNASDTRQMLMLRTNFQADYLYRSMEVLMRASMLVRRIPKGKTGEARLKDDYIPYRMFFIATVKLPGADQKEASANLDRWAADHGNLARQALEMALDWVARRFARNLDETEAEAASWCRRVDKTVRLPDGKRGRVIESGENNWVYFDPYWQGLHFEAEVRP